MSPMNNRLLVPRKVPGLLDLVPGAAAAYSLRSLSNSYAGPVVTVRRSSDNTEEDFTATEVSDGTLAAFCGAGDGFVYRWWDQSGNANHAVAASDATEPRIVDSGILATDGDTGKPALEFKPGAAAESYLTFSRIQNIQHLFAVARKSSALGQLLARDATANDLRGFSLVSAPGKWNMQQIGAYPQPVHSLLINPGETNLLYIKTNGTACQYGLNGAHAPEEAEVDYGSCSQIGRYHISTYSLKGYVSEFIMYQRALSDAEVRNAEGQICWYY
jgi:hypothetical protein